MEEYNKKHAPPLASGGSRNRRSKLQYGHDSRTKRYRRTGRKNLYILGRGLAVYQGIFFR